MIYLLYLSTEEHQLYMKHIVPEKLSTARKVRGLSMEALSLKMGRLVTRQSISKYEQGKMQPSETVLKAFAAALDRPTDYFFEKPIKVSPIRFRIDDKMPAGSVSQMISVAQDKMERYLKLEDMLAISSSFDNPLEDMEIKNIDDVEKTALLLRKRWELGTMPLFSVYEMLESKGIKLIEFDTGVHNVVGFSTIVNDNIPLIVINLTANSTTERKRFTALHELGHILLKFSEGTDEAQTERLCNHFAGALLCPSQVFFHELGQKRTTLTLNELVSMKSRYGISIAAIVHRAKDLGIISDRYYNEIFDRHIHFNIMETGWGCYPINEHTDRFERLLQRAAAERILTKPEICAMTDDGSEKFIKSITVL